MTYRQRKARRRRGRGGGGSRVVALSFGLLVTVLAIVVMSAVGYVIAVAATAPALSELKPADKGESSVIFAADGSRLGYVQSDEIRTPVSWDEMPRVAAPRRGGDRGRALLRARGRGLLGDRPRRGEEPRVRQERAGRLDHHPAAGARAVHQGSRAQRRAQDPRGQAGLRARGGALEEVDPPELPQRRAVRHRRRPHRDRASRAPPRPSSTSTRKDLTLCARPPRWPACRRRRRSTTRSATRRPRSRAATRCSTRMAENGFITRARAITAVGTAARPAQGHPLHHAPRAVLLRLRAGAADRAVRRGRVPPRRSEGAHHDRPQDPGPGARGDQLLLRRPRRTQLGDRLDRPHQRQDQGDGLERHLQGPPLQPRRPGPPPAGLGVQDDGAHRRRAQGHRPRQHLLHVQAAVDSTIPSTGRGR